MYMLFISMTMLLIISVSKATALGDDFTNFVFPKNRITKSLRIIGGQTVIPHSYPFMVALYIKNSPDSTEFSFCGGTLLNTEWVLTAAHCVDSSPYLVRALFGLHDLLNYTNAQIIEVKSYIVHRNWSQKTVQNDIALLKLSNNVTLSDTVQPVKLSNGTDDYTGQTAVLVGWGTTESVTISRVLKSVNSSIISNRQCNNTFGVITSSHICISGQGNKGSCNGDSGGPLLVNNVQVGITSFGDEDCNLSFPSAFTRVASFNFWITANMKGSAASINKNTVSVLISTLPLFFDIMFL